MSKTLALGTILRMSNPATVGMIAIGNLTSLNVPGPTKGEVETTDFDSVAKEFLGTLPDNGELSLSGFFNYANPGQQAMLADANDADAPERDFEIDFTRQDVQFTFSGFVKSFVPNAGGPEEAYTFDATIRVSGAVTPVTPIP